MRTTSLLILLFLVVMVLTAGFPVSAAEKTAESKITGKSCDRDAGKITVPSGNYATDFDIVGELKSGVECVSRDDIEYVGFHIYDYSVNYDGAHYYNDNDQESGLFWYHQDKSTGKVTSGPHGLTLSRLSLPPGKYYMLVDGGDGAKAKISYELSS